MDEINKLRGEIDKIDQELLDLIVRRIELVRAIGAVKKNEGIEVIDEEREKEIFNRLTTLAGEKGIDPDIVKKIWNVLIKISYEIEGVRDENS